MAALMVVLGALVVEVIRFRWSERAKIMGLSFCLLLSLYFTLSWLPGTFRLLGWIVCFVFAAIIFRRLFKAAPHT